MADGGFRHKMGFTCMGVHRSGSLADLEGSEFLDLQSKKPPTRRYPRSRTKPERYFQSRDEEPKRQKPKSLLIGAMEPTEKSGAESEC